MWHMVAHAKGFGSCPSDSVRKHIRRKHVERGGTLEARQVLQQRTSRISNSRQSPLLTSVLTPYLSSPPFLVFIPIWLRNAPECLLFIWFAKHSGRLREGSGGERGGGAREQGYQRE